PEIKPIPQEVEPVVEPKSEPAPAPVEEVKNSISKENVTNNKDALVLAILLLPQNSLMANFLIINV
ncbi:Noggin, partial [Gilliamella apicola SCGC AB-598-I20]